MPNTDIGTRYRAMLSTQEYLDSFLTRLHAGTLAPALEAMAHHYAFGAPPRDHLLPGAGTLTVSWKDAT